MSGGGEHAAHDDWREPRGGGSGGRMRAQRRDDSTSNMKPGTSRTSNDSLEAGLGLYQGIGPP